MAAQILFSQIVCFFNKFGFCKYNEKCRHLHVNEICEDSACDISNCNLRHPKICNWYRQYKKCKFSEYCAYIHVESNMENLVKEKEKMSEYIVNNDKAFKVIDDKVTESQEKILQLEAKFDKVKIIENQINNKDVFIQDLQKRVKIMEISLTEKDEHINNLLERMNFMEEKFKLLENEKHEVSEMEKTFFNPSDVQKQCEQCDYETSSSKELEDHNKKNHMQRFPCDFCEFTAKNEGGLKTHMRAKHTRNMNWKNYKYCDWCNFNSEN